MSNRCLGFTLAFITALTQGVGRAQSTAAAGPTVKTNVEEVVLDLIARDKKGKPITDLKQDEITVTDNGAKAKIASFRLVQGSEAITQNGSSSKLDPLRQLRLVTLAFEYLGDATQRKTARDAAIDLIKGEQGTNVFYSVVAINTRLLVVQPFTADKAALTAAVEKVTSGAGAPKMVSESEAIQAELKRQLQGYAVNGSNQDTNLLAAAGAVANQGAGPGQDNTTPILARTMLDMLRMDAAAVSQGTRLSLGALRSLVQGLIPMPGRKSILYFTSGMVFGSELDVMYNNLIGAANRGNVTFYSVDTRGVTTYNDNAGAMSELKNAANASANTTTRQDGGANRNEIMASDNAENSARANGELRIRELAESTGGFLIGESNDLRGPLRKVNEEISSYYELTYNPGIQNYDGSFRKVSVTSSRKDIVIHARNGYFALPPDAVATGLQAFEMPLLKAISDAKPSTDVEFHSAAVLLRPKTEGTDASLIVEVPLHTLQPKDGFVHCSLAALIKDGKGEVVEKLSRDRSFQVTPDQLKFGNLVEKSAVLLPPGKYTVETAVMDRESGKIGMSSSNLTVNPKSSGVSISSLAVVRGYTPNAKGLDPNEPFQFQGGAITPTLVNVVPRTEGSALRMFFTVYQDAALKTKPTVEIEFLQNGKSLTKVPLPLPDADSQGRIPYVMTIAAASIPAGEYEIKATAKQGDTTAETQTQVRMQ